ncbi:MAG: hypothetical protein AAF658_03495 [Myxococcota bacterium]
MTLNGRDTECLHKLSGDLLTRFNSNEASLTPCVVPLEFGVREGFIGETQVKLRTRRYVSEELRALTFASIVDSAGRTRSVTVIGFPHQHSPLPILGIDLIAFRGTLSLVALDLAPTNAAFWTRAAAPVLEALSERCGDHLKRRKRPEFTHEAFSDLAMIVACPRGKEPVACQAAWDLAESYLKLAQTHSTAPASEEDRSVAQWCSAELRNRKEHDALSRVFGAEFAEAYLGYLFGDFAESPGFDSPFCVPEYESWRHEHA